MEKFSYLLKKDIFKFRIILFFSISAIFPVGLIQASPSPQNHLFCNNILIEQINEKNENKDNLLQGGDSINDYITDTTELIVSQKADIIKDHNLSNKDLYQNTSSPQEAKKDESIHKIAPHILWILPFVALLLSIALFPLIPKTSHWWEHNRNKLLVAIILSIVTFLYYLLRERGFHSEPGFSAVISVISHSVFSDYIPFIILLFSLYTISGGINLSGDVPARPLTNTALIGIGGILASFIGTTGASMLLIRPILQINSERRNVKHTVIFFIFLVSNCGGLLLPLGDPPLFLGYLRGVPFLWTLNLIPQWAIAISYLLILYFIFDSIQYSKEAMKDIILDKTRIQSLKLTGNRNLFLLLGVVFAVAFLVPGQKFPGTNWVIPGIYLRETSLLILALISMKWTPKEPRERNQFNFVAIAEVACLFIGIFITMQVPIEILQIKGPELGFIKSWQFFWASGILSSFLDNAPTYVVYFTTAGSLNPQGMPILQQVLTETGAIAIPLLTGVSLGSVLMGANTYIGNGPNFMVKSIAEQSGIKMPSFFGYMIYSICILFPLYFIIQFLFLRS